MSSLHKTFWMILFISCIFMQDIKGGVTQDSSSTLKQATFYFKQALANMGINADSAYWYLENAIPLYEAEKDWKGYVNCYNGIFYNAYFILGDYENMGPYAEKAWQEAQRLLEPDNEVYGDALNNIALIYENKGDFAQSLSLQRRALELTRAANGAKSDIATSLINIAQIYQTFGDWDSAIPYLEESLQLLQEEFEAEKLEKIKSRVGNNYVLLGRVYQAKEDYARAIDYYLEGQKIFSNLPLDDKRNKDSNVDLYQRLAETYTEAGQAEQSSQWLAKALAIQEKIDYRNYLTYEIWGKTYEALGQKGEALEAFEKALDLAKEKFTDFDRHKIVARQHANLGAFLARQGRLDDAITQYQEGLRRISFDYEPSDIASNPLLENIMSYPEALTLLKAKGEALWQQSLQANGDAQTLLEHSLTSFVAYRQLAQAARLDYHSQGSKNQLASEAVEVYGKALEVAYQLFEKTENQAYLQEAFTFVESNKAMLLLESINQRQANAAGGIPDSLLDLESSMRIDIAFYNRRIYEERSRGELDEKSVEKYKKERFAVQQKYEGLLQKLERNYPNYQQVKDNIDLVDLETLQAGLGDRHSMLLEYFVGKQNLYVFAITQNSVQLFQLPLAENQDEQIGVLLKSLHTYPGSTAMENEFQTFSTASFALYQSWLEPILTQAFAADIHHLVLVPDGALSLLPFEVLLQSMPGAESSYFDKQLDYLFQDYAIRYAYSATLLDRSEKLAHNRATKPYAGFAPSFANPAIASLRTCSLEELYSLPCSEDEVGQVQAILGGNTHLAEAATREAFLASAADYQVLHLATHACIDEENPAFGRIYFSDDYLSNEELFSMQLAADLVVLSACNTGSGKIVEGEGVMSLAKGFTYAGVASSLISLWSIDDCATSDLIGMYYKNLKDGESKAAALQQSRNEYLATADKLHQHPFFWAAFIQMDNDRPLQAAKSGKKMLLMGVVAILAILSLLAFRFRSQQQLDNL